MSNTVSKKKDHRKRNWLIFGGAAVVVIIAIVLIGRNRTQTQAAQYQTAVIARGDLTATVGATGTVRARQTAILGWQTTGTIGEVKVQPGDTVQAGEVLATLDKTSLPQNVILAQADLVSARKALNDLMLSKTAQAQAQLALADAQKNFNTTQANYNYQTSRHADPETIRNAEAQLVIADQNVKLMQGYYDNTAGLADTNITRANAYSNLYAAQQAYARALAVYNWDTGKPTATDLAEWNGKLAVAQAQLDDAQREWDRLKNGPDPNDILAAQARVDAAQAAVDMAQLSTPFAGIVTEVSGLVGDQVAPGTQGFRIDDLSRMQLDVQVSEVDINSIAVGQPVTLTFDAILGKTYNGKVIEVAQAGDVVQGAVNFTVTVELTDADAQVKPGMTAAVNIIVQQLTDVLLVPNRAVRLINDQRVVYVLRGGKAQEIPITLGASSDTNSQVTDGDLKVGDQTILNPPSTLFTGPGNGRGGGPFGGG